MRRELTRSFDTLEAAQKFAEDKADTDIYKSRGRFVVKWVKTCRDYDDDGNKVERYDFDASRYHNV